MKMYKLKISKEILHCSNCGEKINKRRKYAQDFETKINYCMKCFEDATIK